MGVTCPACGTENRSVAKFCIECIGSLPTIFAATEILPHMPHMPHMPHRPQAPHRTPFVREPETREDAAPVRTSGFVAATVTGVESAATTGSQTAPVSSGPQRAVEGRKGLWVSVAALAIALVIGAAGWLVAGAGGLYIYAFGHSGSNGETEVATVPASTATSAASVAAISPASAVAPLAAQAPLAPLVPAIASASAQVAPSASTVVAATPNIAAARSPMASTSQTTAATTAATAAATSTAPSAVARTTAKTSASIQAPAGRGAADPTAQCTGLGFFAASRCMAAQCAKADYSAHPTCTAVLAQQRVMEEKRNPTMAN